MPSVGPGADPGVQAVSPQVTVSSPLGGYFPLLSARPAVTFPAAEHHRPLAGTKLYCLVTYGHLRADCLHTGISSGPNARHRVWESLFIASVYFHGLLLEVCTIICLGVNRHLVSGHEISRLQHGLQLIMARYTRIINCRPCCNLYMC